MAIAEHKSRIRESLENFLAALKSQKTSSTSFVKYCCRLKKRLETQLEFTNSTSFVSGSDIPDITPAIVEPSKTGYTLWRGHYRRLEIKDSTPAACSLCKYIWKVILCMVLTGKRCLRPDIWSEIIDQAKSIEDIIRGIWTKKVYY